MSGTVSWKIFSEVFLAKFFPHTTKTEMERKFINLRQADKTFDEYATKFFKLSQFALYMVSNEENQTRRFQQGLNLKLQRYVISFRYKTFAEVLTAAREQEQLSGLIQRAPIGSIKCLIGQIVGGTSTRQVDAMSPKRQMTTVPLFKMAMCKYYRKVGHNINECRLAYNLCLICGLVEHRTSPCPHSWQVPRELNSAPVG